MGQFFQQNQLYSVIYFFKLHSFYFQRNIHIELYCVSDCASSALVCDNFAYWVINDECRLEPYQSNG